MDPSPRIASLHVHPVKSCAGIALRQVMALPTGLEHDREWMVVDGAGRFVTQREAPRMALIRTALGERSLQLKAVAASVQIPFGHEGPLREVEVWRSRVPAFDAGEEAAAFFSEFLGRDLRLVRFDARHARLSNRDRTGGLRAPNLFSDGYPVLVASEGSLADLNRRCGRDLPMARFRPNIVLEGAAPWAEDRLGDFRAGDAELRIVKPCTRCVITTTDQASGLRDGEEPLRTLKAFRYDASVRGVTFGQNAIVRRPGLLSVGDAVAA
jgi:uncharacterized protein YcbX